MDVSLKQGSIYLELQEQKGKRTKNTYSDGGTHIEGFTGFGSNKVNKENIKEETEQMKKTYLGQEQIIKNLESESGQMYIANLLTNRLVVKFLKNKSK